MADVTLEYAPTLDGQAYDPEDNGGAVDLLTLHSTAERADPPVLSSGPAARVAAGRYRFTFPEPPAGTYYAVVTWRATSTTATIRDDDEIVSFPIAAAAPTPLDLAVTLEDLARAAGYAQPLSPEAVAALVDAARAAQADVEGYLGKSVVPREATVTSEWWPVPRSELPLAPIVRVLSLTENPDGTQTVRYLGGTDLRDKPPVMRYVLAHAAALAQQAPGADRYGVTRGIRSASTEGQSITYDTGGGPAGSGIPGSLPTLESLQRYQRLGAYMRPG